MIRKVIKYLRKVKRVVASLILTAGLLFLAARDNNNAPPKESTDHNQKNPASLPIFTPLDSFRYVDRLRPDWKAPAPYTFVNQSEDSVPADAKDLWRNLQAMKESETFIAPRLMDFSQRANIFFFRTPLKILGHWEDRKGTVSLTNSPKTSSDFLLTTQAHEIIHGIQRTTGVKKTNASWSIFDYQISLLSYEAAASVGGYLTAFEMRERGDSASWKALEKRNPKIAAAMIKQWRQVQNKRLPMSQKLQKMATGCFYDTFQRQGWLNYYNEKVLSKYAARLLKGALKEPNGKRYSMKTMKETGYISNDFNFTAALDYMPSVEMRFGSNMRMRQAFNYLELERTGRICGREDSHYLTLLERAQKNENPYLGISLEKAQSIQEIFRNKITFKDALDFLVSERDNAHAPALFIAP